VRLQRSPGPGPRTRILQGAQPSNAWARLRAGGAAQWRVRKLNLCCTSACTGIVLPAPDNARAAGLDEACDGGEAAAALVR
jgi:hypothetical protein